MSTLRDLVAGQGCAPGPSGGTANPIAALFTDLIGHNRKLEEAGSSLRRVPEAQFTEPDREKISARAGVLARQLYPGASEDFVGQQVSLLLQALSTAGLDASPADDRRFQEFSGAGTISDQAASHRHSLWGAPAAFPRSQQPPSFRVPHAAQPNSWATEFHAAHDAGSPGLWHGPPRQHRQPLQTPAVAANTAAHAWVQQFDQSLHLCEGPSDRQSLASVWAETTRHHAPHGHSRLAPGTPPLAEQWAPQFEQHHAHATGPIPGTMWPGEPTSATRWADEFAAGANAGGEAWVEEFGASGNARPPELLPEQIKAMKGPSPDDPLQDEGAASWVQQFNESLEDRPKNAAQVDWALAAATLRLQQAGNPYAEHPLPMQQARQLAAHGHVADAALAYEVAARAAPGNPATWAGLAECRMDMEDYAGAIPVLQYLVQCQAAGLPELPAGRNQGLYAQLLVECCIETGQASAAVDALACYFGPRGCMPDNRLARTLEEVEAYTKTRSDADAHLWLGLLYLAQRRSQKAVTAFQTALAVRPGDAYLLTQLSRALVQSGRHAEADLALRHATQAADRQPAVGHRVRSLAYKLWGKIETAQGKLVPALTHYVKALTVLDEAHKLHPKHSIWDSISLLLMANGEAASPLAALVDAKELKGLISALPKQLPGSRSSPSPLDAAAWA